MIPMCAKPLVMRRSYTATPAVLLRREVPDGSWSGVHSDDFA